MRIINDPSAGSPTDTLLRLLLPLDNKVQMFSKKNTSVLSIHHFHRIIQSVGATGGVYKGQGRNQRKLMTCAYQEFLVQDQQFQWSIPSLMNIQKISHFFRKRFLHVKRVITRCVHHCSARAAQSIEGHHRPVIASNFHLLVVKNINSPFKKKKRVIRVQSVFHI